MSYWSNAAGDLKKAIDRFEQLNSALNQSRGRGDIVDRTLPNSALEPSRKLHGWLSFELDARSSCARRE